MPGTVIAVQVKAGESVTRGETMMVIESMKLRDRDRRMRATA